MKEDGKFRGRFEKAFDAMIQGKEFTSGMTVGMMVTAVGMLLAFVAATPFVRDYIEKKKLQNVPSYQDQYDAFIDHLKTNKGLNLELTDDQIEKISDFVRSNPRSIDQLLLIAEKYSNMDTRSDRKR